MLKPCPSTPSRLVSGTAQSSNITALVGWEFQPTWRGAQSDRPDQICHLAADWSTATFSSTFQDKQHLFLLLAKTEAWCSLLHHQTWDSFSPLASRSAHHNIHVGVSSPTDKRLREREKKKSFSRTKALQTTKITLQGCSDLRFYADILSHYNHNLKSQQLVSWCDRRTQRSK